MGKQRPVSPDAESSLASESVSVVLNDEPGPTGADSPPPALDAPPTTPPDAPPPGDPPPVEAAEKLTPIDWAHRKGQVVEGPFVAETHVKGFHSAAAQLHGWAWHAHNYQAPEQAFRLSEADYDAALEAASQFPAKPAHAAAIATHYPKPVVPEHIAEACAARDAAEAKKAER